MFSWGKNSYGQLAIADTEDPFVNRPRICRKNNLPVFISCGWAHSALLVNDGTIKTCGCNQYGQLGREGQGVTLGGLFVANLDVLIS